VDNPRTPANEQLTEEANLERCVAETHALPLRFQQNCEDVPAPNLQPAAMLSACAGARVYLRVASTSTRV
jgi:hypothetical protein